MARIDIRNVARNISLQKDLPVTKYPRHKAVESSHQETCWNNQRLTINMFATLNNFLSAFIEPAIVESHPERTLQLATAVLLIEVMKSDAESTDEEQATILNILKKRFLLSDAEVSQLTERGIRTAKAANDFHQFTSLINRELVLSEKIRIIEYMWQVAYADKIISAHENHVMRKMADLLHISHGDYVAAKMRAKPADLK